MSRPLRIEYAGALYHVVSHGNGKLWLFKRDADYKKLLDLCGEYSIKYRVDVHAFLLMRNHIHLIIETLEPNLSQFMCQFLRGYAMYYNNILKRIGSVFKTRYGAFIIQKEKYYKNVISYIYYNPVRAGIVENPYEYRWSSLYYLRNPEILDEVKWFDPELSLSNLGGKDGIKDIISGRLVKFPILHNVFIGEKKWAEKLIKNAKVYDETSGGKKIVKSVLSPDKIIEEVSQHYNINKKKIISKRNKDATMIAIYLISKFTSLKMKEIGKIFGMNGYAISQRLKRFKENKLEEKKETINTLIGKLKKE